MWQFVAIGVGVVIVAIIGGIHAQLNNDEEEKNDVESRQRNKRLASSYPSQLVTEFEILAMTLETCDEYLKEVEAMAENIYEYLHQQKAVYGLQIDRYKIAGSVGKGTSISFDRNGKTVNPDLDMVIFINYVKPPFSRQLNLFAYFLRNLKSVSNVTVRKFSIEFKLWSRSLNKHIQVDLLAARNVVNNSKLYDSEEEAELEASRILKNLNSKQRQAMAKTHHVDVGENKLNSSALAEKTVQIIRHFVEDPYVKCVVRICKYWNYMVDLKAMEVKYKYIPARSCIMELIAIYCQQGQDRDLISGFQRFLEAVADFPNLNISLNYDDENCRGLVKEDNKPLVRDPVNKWNNYAEGIPNEVIKIWQNQACKTLLLLQEFRNNSNCDFENAIDILFRHKIGDYTVLDMEERFKK